MGKVLDWSKALVLFSGGQDSTTCLAWALTKFSKVYTIGFDYGQRHHSELECRKHILTTMATFPRWNGVHVADIVLDMRFLGIVGDSSLTSEKVIEWKEGELPNTFVPGRNLLFLTASAGYAYLHSIQHIIGGMSQADFSGYPDCRKETLDAQLRAINLGMDAVFQMHYPLMEKNKEAVWRMAHELGGQKFVDLVRSESHTCYQNDRTHLNEWGFGCGHCPACVLRKNGYRMYRESKAM